MLPWLLVNLLVFPFYDRSYYRWRSIAIKVDPRSIGILVPFYLLLAEHLDVLRRTWRDRQLILVNLDMLKTFSIENVWQCSIIKIIVLWDFLRRAGTSILVTLTWACWSTHRLLICTLLTFIFSSAVTWHESWNVRRIFFHNFCGHRSSCALVSKMAAQIFLFFRRRYSWVSRRDFLCTLMHLVVNGGFLVL